MTTRIITRRNGDTFTVLLDDEDAPKYDALSWYIADGYVIHTVGRFAPKLRLHRYLMDTPDDMQVDHRDSNKLNNQKSNLRVCTAADNLKNKSRCCDNTTGYIGISFKRDSWQAEITADGKYHYLGQYSSAIEAARARDEAAKELHGEFARLNFPDGLALAS